jgi:hypothetical protein
MADEIKFIPKKSNKITVNTYEKSEYKTVNDIKIFTGATDISRVQHELTTEYFKNLVPKDEKLFTELEPSTLTAQGMMSHVTFDEKDIMDMLSDPTGDIMLIGCNFGEKTNPEYKPKVVIRKSGRGRKPKPKVCSKRKVQGSGKYFSSQITFIIKHPKLKTLYKIKLFRNGVFIVPGVKDPSMEDLIEPVTILRDYLAYNFSEPVQIVNFNTVMRNYKSKLLRDDLHVDLEELERYINDIKKPSVIKPFIDYMLRGMPKQFQKNAMKFIGKTNSMNIAEVAYNTDRCFCLIIKFYRPIPDDVTKKTTVKLLKRGKINFDGGNSEIEVQELYYWLRYIYWMKRNDILVDVTKIKNEYNHDEMRNLDPDDFIYDESDEEELNECCAVDDSDCSKDKSGKYDESECKTEDI